MLEAHRVLRGNCVRLEKLHHRAVGRRRRARANRGTDSAPPGSISVEQPGDLGGPLVYMLTRKNGQRVPLPQREVLHLRGLSTDGFMGRSVLQDARELIGGALATQEHSNTTWKRDGLPSVVLRHPKTLSDKAKDGLEKSWEKGLRRVKGSAPRRGDRRGDGTVAADRQPRGSPVSRHAQVLPRRDRGLVLCPAAHDRRHRKVDVVGHRDRAAADRVSVVHVAPGPRVLGSSG